MYKEQRTKGSDAPCNGKMLNLPTELVIQGLGRGHRGVMAVSFELIYLHS